MQKKRLFSIYKKGISKTIVWAILAVALIVIFGLILFATIRGIINVQ